MVCVCDEMTWVRLGRGLLFIFTGGISIFFLLIKLFNNIIYYNYNTYYRIIK